jgi:hypothetical protein
LIFTDPCDLSEALLEHPGVDGRSSKKLEISSKMERRKGVDDELAAKLIRCYS